MHTATEDATNAANLRGRWRISVDRAWRSREMRGKFEADTGVAPLDVADEGRRTTGELAAYYEDFLLWATRYLRLEEQAPPPIRAKLRRG